MRSINVGSGNSATLLAGFIAALLLSGCQSRPHAQAAPSDSAVVGSRDSLGDVGFAAPENLVYDSIAKVLLVTNINGDPTQQDANGFISRVSPSGKVLALKWIDGSAPQTRLDAPKGIAIRGDTIFVADVKAVRRFDRATGRSLGVIPVGGIMLNDLVFAPDGKLYITDSGPNRPPDPTQKPDTSKDIDAVYVRDAHGVHVQARGTDLQRPDGIQVVHGTIVFATLGGKELLQLDSAGRHRTYLTLATGKLDGLRLLPDGTLLLTSWDGKQVYRIGADQSVATVLDGIESPAGVTYDAADRKIFVTSLNTNRLYWRSAAVPDSTPD